LSELIIRENGVFFEAIHAFADFDINVAFGVKMRFGQIVVGNNLGSEMLAVNPHVLIDDHVGDQEEVI
jgi:hypothetical protein